MTAATWHGRSSTRRVGVPEGEDGLRVLVYSTGQDTGGQGYRIGQGFATHAPAWHVDVLNDSPSSLGYPEQQVGSRLVRNRDAAALYSRASVVHLRNTLRGWQQLDRGQGKPTLLHHHGTMFRDGHGRLAQLARQLGAVQVASTVDLCLLEPGVSWLPSPYDEAELASLRAQAQVGRRDDGLVRVAHLPTSARKKQSGIILPALRQLQQDGMRLEIITNVDATGHERHLAWPQALWHKAQADVYVDQLVLGYGNNAVEAWGMGQPVVAGVADPAVRADMLARWGALPFLEATPDTVHAVLAKLLASASMRAEWAARGLEHFRRYHAARLVVQQLQDLYLSCPPTQTVPQYVQTARQQARRADALARQQARAARVAGRLARTAAAARGA